MKAHLPVLLNEVLEVLAPQLRKTFLDCTFGGGGHTKGLLQRDPSINVFALDCDPEANLRAKSVHKIFGDRFQFYDLNFTQINQIPHSSFDGILFDLGVSSFQLDTPERGFSFRYDSFIDMRMNPREGIAATDFLEKASFRELEQAIRNYGEERHWRKVIYCIMENRGKGLLQNARLFAERIAAVLPRSRKNTTHKIHPATRTLQGIRIAINKELEALEQTLPKAMQKLAIGGILAVISFHSLEDRIVKRFFRRMAGLPEHRADNRSQMERVQQAEILTSKPMEPSEEEKQLNPRSRSAKLRVLRKQYSQKHNYPQPYK